MSLTKSTSRKNKQATSKPESQPEPENLPEAENHDQPQEDGEFWEGPALDELLDDIPDDLAGREGEVLPPAPRRPDPAVAAAIGPALGLLLNMGFARAGVSPVNEQEQAALGQAAAMVAAQYDLAALSPKTAAWLGLGSVGVGVMLPRIAELQSRDDKPDASPENPTEPVTEARALGEDGLQEVGANG